MSAETNPQPEPVELHLQPALRRNIDRYRLKKGWSYAKLAKAVTGETHGRVLMFPSTVYRIITGLGDDGQPIREWQISAKEIEGFALAFGITTDLLMYEYAADLTVSYDALDALANSLKEEIGFQTDQFGPYWLDLATYFLLATKKANLKVSEAT